MTGTQPQFSGDFSRHVAVDIGGSLAKVVFFTSTAEENNHIKDVYSRLCFSQNEMAAVNDAKSKDRPVSTPVFFPNDAPSINDTCASESLRSTTYVDGSIRFPLEIPICVNQMPNKAVVSFFDQGSKECSSTSTMHNVIAHQYGHLHFLKFETNRIEDCIEFIKDALFTIGNCVVKATGGGAYKYAQLFRERLGVELVKLDELESLIRGLNFLLLEIPQEAFTYSNNMAASAMLGMTTEEQQEWLLAQPITFVPVTKDDIYPYMVVNIGSGVSILLVTGPTTFERISGTSLGGGTFWGLLSLLTNCKSFDEMLELCARGENKHVDMLVSDIYDGDYPKIGLKANTIASSFGKVFRRNNSTKLPYLEGVDETASCNLDEERICVDKKRSSRNGHQTTKGKNAKRDTSGEYERCSSGNSHDEEEEDGKMSLAEKRRRMFREEDMAKSLLYMVSNNIGQIAYLTAMHHGMKRIFFGGHFIRGHTYTMHTISFAINYWSKGTMRAYFLRHEGYLGAVGAFLSEREETEEETSF